MTENELGTEILSKVKATLVFAGFGRLTITDKALFWNKSASSYIAFGLAATATDNHLFLPFSEIVKVESYHVILSGGLVLTTNTGKIYKIALKHKKDFDIAYDYLLNSIENKKSSAM